MGYVLKGQRGRFYKLGVPLKGAWYYMPLYIYKYIGADIDVDMALSIRLGVLCNGFGAPLNGFGVI